MPGERREVHPVAARDAHREILSRKDERLLPTGPVVRLRGIHQSSSRFAVGVDDLDTGVDDSRVGVLAREVVDPADVVRLHHVVASENDDPLRFRKLEALLEGAVDAEILCVAKVVDAGIGDQPRPLAGRRIGVRVVDDHEPPAGIVLIQHALNGLSEMVLAAVERQHDIEHRLTSVDWRAAARR